MKMIRFRNHFINLDNVLYTKTRKYDGVWYIVFHFSQGEWQRGEGFLNDQLEFGGYKTQDDALLAIENLLEGVENE